MSSSASTSNESVNSSSSSSISSPSPSSSSKIGDAVTGVLERICKSQELLCSDKLTSKDIVHIETALRFVDEHEEDYEDVFRKIGEQIDDLWDWLCDMKHIPNHEALTDLGRFSTSSVAEVADVLEVHGSERQYVILKLKELGNAVHTKETVCESILKGRWNLNGTLLTRIMTDLYRGDAVSDMCYDVHRDIYEMESADRKYFCAHNAAIVVMTLYDRMTRTQWSEFWYHNFIYKTCEDMSKIANTPQLQATKKSIWKLGARHEKTENVTPDVQASTSCSSTAASGMTAEEWNEQKRPKKFYEKITKRHIFSWSAIATLSCMILVGNVAAVVCALPATYCGVDYTIHKCKEYVKKKYVQPAVDQIRKEADEKIEVAAKHVRSEIVTGVKDAANEVTKMVDGRVQRFESMISYAMVPMFVMGLIGVISVLVQKRRRKRTNESLTGGIRKIHSFTEDIVAAVCVLFMVPLGYKNMALMYRSISQSLRIGFGTMRASLWFLKFFDVDTEVVTKTVAEVEAVVNIEPSPKDEVPDESSDIPEEEKQTTWKKIREFVSSHNLEVATLLVVVIIITCALLRRRANKHVKFLVKLVDGVLVFEAPNGEQFDTPSENAELTMTEWLPFDKYLEVKEYKPKTLKGVKMLEDSCVELESGNNRALKVRKRRGRFVVYDGKGAEVTFDDMKKYSKGTMLLFLTSDDMHDFDEASGHAFREFVPIVSDKFDKMQDDLDDAPSALNSSKLEVKCSDPACDKPNHSEYHRRAKVSLKDAKLMSPALIPKNPVISESVLNDLYQTLFGNAEKEIDQTPSLVLTKDEQSLSPAAAVVSESTPVGVPMSKSDLTPKPAVINAVKKSDKSKKDLAQPRLCACGQATTKSEKGYYYKQCETCALICACGEKKKFPAAPTCVTCFHKKMNESVALPSTEAGLASIDLNLLKRQAKVVVKTDTEERTVHGFNVSGFFYVPYHAFLKDSEDIELKTEFAAVSAVVEYETRVGTTTPPTYNKKSIVLNVKDGVRVKDLDAIRFPLIGDLSSLSTASAVVGASTWGQVDGSLSIGKVLTVEPTRIVYDMGTEKGWCGSAIMSGNKVIAFHTTGHKLGDQKNNNWGIPISALSKN